MICGWKISNSDNIYRTDYMKKMRVAVVRYEKPMESVKKAVQLCDGLAALKPGTKVFIKPNIVFWKMSPVYPKWGVVTTSRVIEDMVLLLKEKGINDITIGEGMVVGPKDIETPEHAFESLGYGHLKKRYGVQYLNLLSQPYQKTDLGGGVVVKMNTEILSSDFVVNLPVLKTHSQTHVSLGIKNLKGTIDVPSRKKFHGVDQVKDLHYQVARLHEKMPPMFTLIDGIFSNERGPGIDGHIRRLNILVASNDVLAGDFVGAKLLGFEPAAVPHLVHAAANQKRSLDLDTVEVVGENISDLALVHKSKFEFGQDDEGNCLPAPLIRRGLRGLSYRQYDLTLCTYCAEMTGHVITAVAGAWKGTPWDKVEVLTGKKMKPTKGMNKTILLGKCMYQAHKKNPDIAEMIAVKGCPPKADDIVKAFHKARIKIDPNPVADPFYMPGLHMKRYKDKPEFDENLFKVQG
jgi:uncharacterized protein (DUF362 family)